MTIRDRQKYAEAAWDWAILDGCFHARISPCDVDGVVERRGKFLFMECKPGGGDLSQGQKILLTNLADVPNHTVLVLFGARNEPQTMIAMGDFARVCPYIRYGERRPVDLDVVRRFAADWYRHAEGRPLGIAPAPNRRFTEPRTPLLLDPNTKAYLDRKAAERKGAL